MCILMQVWFIITNVASWIRENTHYFLGIIFSVLMACAFCSIWIENNDLRDKNISLNSDKISLLCEIQLINKSLLSEIHTINVRE